MGSHHGGQFGYRGSLGPRPGRPGLVASPDGPGHGPSVAGFQPVPYMATYAATKTYVERLGLALWYEFRRRGVRVYVLAPGYTATRFHERAQMSRRPPFPALVATPESVVADCLRQMERRPDRCLIVPGWTNRMMYRLVRWLPLSLVVRTAGAMYRPRGRRARRGIRE
jgi:short-subunit dehydrogenase